VHLGIILVINQLDALFSRYLLFHLSTCFEHLVLIIRRVKLYYYSIWYISHSVGDCLVCRSGRNCLEKSASSWLITRIKVAIYQSRITYKRGLRDEVNGQFLQIFLQSAHRGRGETYDAVSDTSLSILMAGTFKHYKFLLRSCVEYNNYIER
jgi:hypothetical protein